LLRTDSLHLHLHLHVPQPVVPPGFSTHCATCLSFLLIVILRILLLRPRSSGPPRSAHLENCGSQRFRRIGLLILSVQIVLLALLRSEPNGQVLVPRQYHPTETPFRTHSCESIDCGFATSTFRHCASTLRTADYTVAVIANRSSSRNLSTFTNTGLLRSTISRPDRREQRACGTSSRCTTLTAGWCLPQTTG